MRTTLTLDPDVAASLQTVMKRRRLTLKAAINEALRAGLATALVPVRAEPFVVKPHACGGFAPGVDPSKLGQLADELDAEARVARGTAARR